MKDLTSIPSLTQLDQTRINLAKSLLGDRAAEAVVHRPGRQNPCVIDPGIAGAALRDDACYVLAVLVRVEGCRLVPVPPHEHRLPLIEPSVLLRIDRVGSNVNSFYQNKHLPVQSLTVIHASCTTQNAESMARSPLRSKLFLLLERAVDVHEELPTCTGLSAKKWVRITDRQSEWKAQETGHGDC